MFAPFAPRSARPSIATRVTMLSFCDPTVVPWDIEYADDGKDRGGLPVTERLE